ncbi:hypothetical protein RRG08_009908 [Elysia crispata]|uniref:Uncharacterized protein n=1 Tax=Elysia crispata TaxID=231223 RepID=A0AAE1ARB0_9GAST|nr:hypothetical protein RRG08_009908 [Elysia crispata]
MGDQRSAVPSLATRSGEVRTLGAYHWRPLAARVKPTRCPRLKLSSVETVAMLVSSSQALISVNGGGKDLKS